MHQLEWCTCICKHIIIPLATGGLCYSRHQHHLSLTRDWFVAQNRSVQNTPHISYRTHHSREISQIQPYPRLSSQGWYLRHYSQSCALSFIPSALHSYSLCHQVLILTLQDGYPQSWKLVECCTYMISVLFTYMNNHAINHISLNKKGRPGHYVKSPTVQDKFQPIPHTSDYGTDCDLLCIRKCATFAIHVLTLLCNNSTTVFSSNTTSSSFVPSASSFWSLTICSNGGRRSEVSYHVMDLLPPFLAYCKWSKPGGGEGLRMRLTTIPAIQ